MKTKVWIHSVQVALIAIIAVLPLDCRKDEDNMPNPAENKQVEKVITAASGGTLTTSDSVKLVIPPYALPMDGKVFIGRTGNEPSSVPNKNLRIEGEPITMRLPSDSILKPIQLSFPRPSGSIDTNNCFVFLFNGSTYFPMEYSLTGTKVIVSIDKINWEISDKKGAIIEYIVDLLVGVTPPAPPALEMGLKKVSIRSGTMYFESPTANSSSKVLLLVHGLMGNPDSWNVFLSKIVLETNPKYSEFWTFGYSSYLSIESNAELLAGELKRYAKGAQIDIVAHSMGGLVSRSAIEQSNGAQYISKLITLGTPHKGSPLAALRYVEGALVTANLIEAYYNLQIYNYFIQGVRDLDPSSKFIDEMDGLDHSPVLYFTIAAVNDPSQNIFSNYISENLLPGPDDGVVSVSSAHGVNGAVSPETDVNIPVAWAHLHMIENSTIYEQVLSFLCLNSSNDIIFNPNVEYGSMTDQDGNTYKTVTIGTQTWMAENLKTTKYRNGDLIGTTTPATLDISSESTPKYQWAYNGNEGNVSTYGRLYTWYAVNTGKLCPIGWHVPTIDEWGTLDIIGWQPGDELKEYGTTHWSATGATNKSGFTALPGGDRLLLYSLSGYLNGTFLGIGDLGIWWSSTELYTSILSYAWYRYLSDWNDYLFAGYGDKRSGFSIRCVKD